ncbi:MAG: peptidyl-prolyl cis-trans isomerase, EpsD family, partial [Gallionellaceae bacterium]|nr:peptidyl-prolyl cis-trans isomerase, EpsD family [Gallionellaceae bacterium]
WLTSQNIPFGGNATTKAAEQLPLELLPRFHQMKDGQIGVLPSKDGVLMVQLMASRTAPMDQKAATPFIEQFLMNQKKVETSNKELKQLREQAKIEYLGDFAKTDEAPKAAATTPATPTTPATAAAPTPPVTVAAKPAASAIPNAAALEKGIAGLK